MLLGSDGQCLVLWVSDSKKNGAPDLSELRRIEWDAATKRIRCYQARTTLAPAANTAYDLTTTNFLATTAALRGTSSFPAVVWAQGVSGWSTSPTVATPATRLIAYGVTIDLSVGGTHTARSAAALRGTPANAG